MKLPLREKILLLLNAAILISPFFIIMLPWASVLGNTLTVALLSALAFLMVLTLILGLKISIAHFRKHNSLLSIGQKLLLLFPILNVVFIITSFLVFGR